MSIPPNNGKSMLIWSFFTSPPASLVVPLQLYTNLLYTKR